MQRLLHLFGCIALVALILGVSAQRPTTKSSAQIANSQPEVTAPVSADQMWEDRPVEVAAMRSVQREQKWIAPDSYRSLALNQIALTHTLSMAPLEASVDVRRSPVVMSFPMPNGTYARFRVVESPIMGPELAAEWSHIKTYLGQGIDDPTATVRFDVSPVGLRAMILSENSRSKPFSQRRWIYEKP